MFNSGQYKLFATVRVDSSTTEDEETEMLAFTNEQNSCFFAIRTDRQNNYALLSEVALKADYLGLDY